MTRADGSQPAPPRAAVIVLNWNGRQYLEPCLQALAGQTYRDFETVVVDNGSTDGSLELLQRFPGVQVIRNPENRGFAAANNQAIRATSAPYVVTLNNDTVVEPGWLGALVEVADAGPDVGAVASKMVFAARPEVINSCGIALDGAAIAWDVDGGQPAASVTSNREVFGACAGAALYKRAMLDEIGLFEEAFFAYLEDVDLAWRARRAGWRTILAANAVVRHVHSGTLGDASPRKRFLLGRNKLRTLARCLPARDLWRLPIILAYDLASVGNRIVRGDWAAIAGRLAALVTLPRLLAQRASIRGGAAVSYAPLTPPWKVPERYRHLDAVVAMPASRGAVPAGSSRHQIRDGMLRGAAFALDRVLPDRPLDSVLKKGRPLKIAVLRPDHLGDVLLTRPAIETLHAELPEAEITVISGPWGAPALQGLPARAVSFPFPGFERAPKSNVLAPYAAALVFAGHLAREQFDAVVVLRPDHWWGALVSRLARIPTRVGQDRPAQRAFLTDVVPALDPERATDSAVRVARHAARVLGSAAEESTCGVTFVPTEGARRRIKEWIDRQDLRRPRVAIHPGAGAEVKLWPGDRWATVARELSQSGASLVLSGGVEDESKVAEIGRLAGAPWESFVGRSWDELAALYEAVDLVVGMDSGPLHLATAVGTPTVRVYGPTDPAIYGPAADSSSHVVLASQLACAPCGNLVAPPCGYTSSPPCLAAIRPDELTAAALKLLRVGVQ